MTRCRDEELLAKVITHKLILPHRHVGEAAAIKLMVNPIDVIRA